MWHFRYANCPQYYDVRQVRRIAGNFGASRGFHHPPGCSSELTHTLHSLEQALRSRTHYHRAFTEWTQEHRETTRTKKIPPEIARLSPPYVRGAQYLNGAIIPQ